METRIVMFTSQQRYLSSHHAGDFQEDKMKAWDAPYNFHPRSYLFSEGGLLANSAESFLIHGLAILRPSNKKNRHPNSRITAQLVLKNLVAALAIFRYAGLSLKQTKSEI